MFFRAITIRFNADMGNGHRLTGRGIELKLVQQNPHITISVISEVSWCERAQQFRVSNMSPDWDSFPDRPSASHPHFRRQRNRQKRAQSRQRSRKNKRAPQPAAPFTPPPRRKFSLSRSLQRRRRLYHRAGGYIAMAGPNAQTLEIKAGRNVFHTACC